MSSLPTEAEESTLQDLIRINYKNCLILNKSSPFLVGCIIVINTK